MFDYKPIKFEFHKKTHDEELISTIATSLKLCGIYGEDNSEKVSDVLKTIGRYDLLPPCER